MSPFYEDIIYKNIFKRLNNIEYKIDKLIDTLAWWIPIRKWRDNFRNKFFDKFIGGGNNSLKFIYPFYFRLYLNWQL